MILGTTIDLVLFVTGLFVLFDGLGGILASTLPLLLLVRALILIVLFPVVSIYGPIRAWKFYGERDRLAAFWILLPMLYVVAWVAFVFIRVVLHQGCISCVVLHWWSVLAGLVHAVLAAHH